MPRVGRRCPLVAFAAVLDLTSGKVYDNIIKHNKMCCSRQSIVKIDEKIIIEPLRRRVRHGWSTPAGPARRPGLGFTIPEMLVTLTLVAVLAALAGPPLAQFIRGAHLTSTASQLEADLQLARREAIKRNGRVLVCPTPAATCGTTAWASTSWAAGWFVCYDADGDGTCDTTSAADPNPIRSRGAIPTTLALTGPTAAARFNSDGTQGGGATTVGYTLTGTWSGWDSYCDSVTGNGSISRKRSATCP
jgi:type IV fimbrial biogenesis protein FimT